MSSMKRFDLFCCHRRHGDIGWQVEWPVGSRLARRGRQSIRMAFLRRDASCSVIGAERRQTLTEAAEETLTENPSVNRASLLTAPTAMDVAVKYLRQRTNQRDLCCQNRAIVKKSPWPTSKRSDRRRSGWAVTSGKERSAG
jgi:hypothetical protein